jgi:hypothetical protein
VTERVVAVLVRRPEGVDARLAAAMLEDVVDLVEGTPEVEAALLIQPGADELADRVAWPGTSRVAMRADASLGQLVASVADQSATAAAVVVADVPDLPSLLLGKLFSAIAGPPPRSLAVCPAAGGGLVAVAAALPPAGWVASCQVGIDDVDAVERLTAAAPRGELAVGPGWHRVRVAGDTALLDPGLEGWEATRAVLG